MQYVRELEGKVLALRAEQALTKSRFRQFSFFAGFVAGSAAGFVAGTAISLLRYLH